MATLLALPSGLTIFFAFFNQGMDFVINAATAPQAPVKPAAAAPAWLPFVAIFIVVVSSLAVFFGHLGEAPLFNPDEGLYAEPAREMLDTGQYITTLLNYSVRFTKPPLVIWLMALSYKLFGVNEFAARFPVALSGTLLVTFSYLFLAKFLKHRVALLAAFILLTAPMCIGVGRMAIVDMPLSLFISGALMSFFTAFRTKRRWLAYLGYFLIGLAIMTKGPVGFVLPILVMAAFHVLTGSIRDAVKLYNLPLGLLIVAAVSLPWFIVEIYLTRGAYFQEFILRENIQRFTSVVDSHKGGWWYHLAALAGGFFPWSVFLPQAIVFFLVATYQKFRAGQGLSAVFGPSSAERKVSQMIPEVAEEIAPEESRQQVRILAFCWVMITVIFFSLSVSKLLPYTLPAFPGLAALVALELDEAVASGKLVRLLVPFSLIAIVFGSSIVLAPYALDRMREAPVGLAQILGTFGTCQECATLLALLLICFGWRKQAVAVFATSLLVFILYFGGLLLPGLAKSFEGDVPNYARQAALAGAKIIVFDLRKPGIPFYARRRVIQPEDSDRLDQTLKTLSDAFIITRTRDLKRFEQSTHCTIVAKDARFALIRWQSDL